MDPLSVTGSIIAVLQLSSDLLKYIKSIKAATREQRLLRDEISRCHSVLVQLQKNSDDSTSDGDQGQWRTKIQAIEGPHSPLLRIAAILGTLDAKLKDQLGMKRVASALKWPFTKAEVHHLTQEITRDMQLLELALTVDCNEWLRQIQQSSMDNGQLLNTVEAAIAKLNDHWATTRRKTILDWIPAFDFGAKHSELIRQKQGGTGQWFLESPKINAWLKNKGSILFCPGIPGAGKSILTAILVEHLLKLYRSSSDDYSVGVTYIYFEYRTENAWKPENLIASLLKQLCWGISPLPEALQLLYDKHMEATTWPSSSEFLGALSSVASRLTRSFVLIDAVDECSMPSRCRKQFVADLIHICGSVGMNLLATARDFPDVHQLFNGYEVLKICAHDDDIRRFIDGRMPRLPEFVQESTKLRETIRTIVVPSARGMFLLARGHLDSLEDERILTVTQAKAALAKLPDNYDRMYHEAMERIEAQSPNRRELAKKTLSWIIYANRPLTTSELQQAVTVEPGDNELEEESLPRIVDIVSVCAGLVEIDDACGAARLIHYTAQEYFESNKSRWFPSMEAHITSILMSYLSFPKFEDIFYDPDTGLMERDYNNLPVLILERAAEIEGAEVFKMSNQDFPLYAYAARYWVPHASLGVLEPQEVFSFLSCEPCESQMVSGSLLWAARSGHEEIVQWLVEHGADVNVHDASCRTPLHYAVCHGWPSCIQLLLEHGAELKADIDNMSPLHWSVLRGKDELLRIMLNAGVPIDFAVNREIWVPVHNSGQSVYSPITTTSQSPTNSRELNGLTSLHLAALMGSQRMVKLLLDNNANTSAVSEYGETPLHLALKRNLHGASREQYPDSWNESDYRVEAAYDEIGFWPGSDDEWSAAQIYVEIKRFSILTLLLTQGSVAISMQDVYGAYPVHCIKYDSEPATLPPELTAAGCILKLSQHGASILARNKLGQTPLQLACLAGDVLAVRRLLAYGSDAMHYDADGQTALHYAVRHAGTNNHEITWRLLDSIPTAEATAVVAAKDKHGANALHHALGKDGCADPTVVSYLFTYGVGEKELNSAGLSPAANYFSRHDISPDPSEMVMLRLLFDSGIDPTVKFKEKGLSLAHLYSGGYWVSVSVLSELATSGVDLGSQDGEGRTLLHHIALGGSLTSELLHYLCVEAGLSKTSRDTHGKTAICYAVDRREHHHPDSFDSGRWRRTEGLLQG